MHATWRITCLLQSNRKNITFRSPLLQGVGAVYISLKQILPALIGVLKKEIISRWVWITFIKAYSYLLYKFEICALILKPVKIGIEIWPIVETSAWHAFALELSILSRFSNATLIFQNVCIMCTFWWQKIQTGSQLCVQKVATTKHAIKIQVTIGCALVLGICDRIRTYSIVFKVVTLWNKPITHIEKSNLR